MKGDFSRQTFRASKHYSAVLMQQGRVQLDADWNEQQAIAAHRAATATADVIGPTGGPRGAAGFEITAKRKDLVIGKGRYYVDGILCENEEDVPFTSQPSLVQIDKKLLEAQLEIDRAGAESDYKFKLDNDIRLAKARFYLAYLDVWQRHVTALEDDEIRETALGGPDTASRSQTVWQVRLLPVKSGGAKATCKTELEEWEALVNPAHIGTLAAKSESEEKTPDPLCTLPPGAGYQGLENQLYRVEIHAGGDLGEARFKWSRDNGTVASAIESTNGVVVSGSTVTLREMGKDGVLTFASDPQPAWVELTDDRYEFALHRGTLAPVDTVDPIKRTITFKAGSSLPVLDPTRHPIVRRWDQSDAKANADGMLTTDGWQTLENGVQVLFGKGRYRTGDYWLIPARTAVSLDKGHVEWPVNEHAEPVPQLPQGTRHHYACLALLRRDSSGFTVVDDGDCRNIFPPLTAITAADVSFSDVTSQLGATNVQEAIDLLVWRLTCTLVLTPGMDIAAAVKKMPAEGGTICFRPGTYTLNAPVTIEGSGRLRITGAGEATRIEAPGSEAALVVKGWKHVSVKDLSVAAGVAAHTVKRHPPLDAALMFEGCGAVVVEGVSASCGSGIERKVACMSAINTDPADGVTATASVRIRGCDLRPGDRQGGVLVANAGRVTIEDNVIRAGGKAAATTAAGLFTDKRFRRENARKLIRHLEVNPKTFAANRIATVRYQGGVVSLATDPDLVTVWPKLVAADKPKEVSGDQALRSYVKQMADKIIALQGAIETVRPDKTTSRWDAFVNWYNRMLKEMGLDKGSARLDDQSRKKLREALAADVRAGARTLPAENPRMAEVGFGGITLRFETEPQLASDWQKLLTAANPTTITKPQAMADYFRMLVDRTLRAGGAANLTQLAKWLDALIKNYRVTVERGIAVAGKSESDVRVINNSVHDAQQGIHVGLSHSGAPRATRDVLGRALIDGNTIDVLVTPVSTGQSHGVSVGNATSVVVENNRIAVSAPAGEEVIGIQMIGQFGPMLVVHQNHIDKARTGIFVRALEGSSRQSCQWLAADNLARGAVRALDAPPEMRDVFTHA